MGVSAAARRRSGLADETANREEPVRGVQEEFQFRNLSGDPAQGLQIDGDFGPKTDNAVRGFQDALGLAVDGIVVQIGALARLVLPGEQRLSIWLTLLTGVIGSVVGGTIANLLLLGTGDIFELSVLGFVVAVVASAGLIIAAERIGIGAGPGRGSIGPGRR